MRKNFLLLLALSSSLFILNACQDHIVEENRSKPIQRVSDLQQTIPYESRENLRGLYQKYQNEGIIHYRIARILIYAELNQSMIQLLGSNLNSYALTKYPVVVYDANNKPLFYEFGVLSGDSIIATITANVYKDEEGVVDYILPPIDYTPTFNCKRFTNLYPYELFYGLKTDTIPTYRLERGVLVKGHIGSSYTMSTLTQATVNCMPSEDQKDMIVYTDSLDKERRQDSLSASLFWKNMEQTIYTNVGSIWSTMQVFLNDNDDASDAIETNTYAQDQKMATILAQNMQGSYQNIYELPQYQDLHLRFTRWKGFCGPAALAFVYRGIYSCFPKNSQQYLNLVGDSPRTATQYFNNRGAYAFYDLDVATNTCPSFYDAKLAYRARSQKADFGLSQCFYDECFWFGSNSQGYNMPLGPCGMNRGMQRATNNEYKIALSIKPFQDIRNQHPLIINVGLTHYVVAIGNAKSKCTKYVLIVDNGTLTGEHSYSPFWMRQAKGVFFYSVYK